MLVPGLAGVPFRQAGFLIAAGTAVASGLVAYSVRLEPPVDEPAMRETVTDAR